MANYVQVQPKILRWAVERSGVPIEEFQQPVEEWLNQESEPTFSKLEAFAKKAMVPFGYLFLSEPPAEELPVPDYRTKTDDGVRRPSPNLLDTIFDMQRRQQWMREYLLEEGQEKLPFVGSANVGDDGAAVAAQIRQELKLKPAWARGTKSIEEALRLLRERIEQAGILIFISGIIGNNTSRSLNAEEFQGFVLADEIAPLIFVNGADYKAAQMFTIAHELVHVWVGRGALFNNLAANTTDVKLEKYCNQVAAEFLVPADLVKSDLTAENTNEAGYKRLGGQFKVSPIVIARRALELGVIQESAFFAFYRAYKQKLEAAPKKTSSGGNFWLTQNVRLGKRFGRAVIAAAKEGRLSYTDAYALTSLHGKTFDKYMHLLNEEGGA